MNSIDQVKVSKLLDEIREAVKRLETIAGFTREDFLGSFTNTGAAKYNLIIGIEAMINISNHILSRLKLGTPEDYADVFKIVNKANIFAEEEIANLVEMARYRNKLVHLYWKIDDSEVYRRLKDNIRTFEKFEKSITKYLRRKPK